MLQVKGELSVERKEKQKALRRDYTKLLEITQQFSDILAADMPELREVPTGNDEEESAPDLPRNTEDESVKAQNEPPSKKLKVTPADDAEAKPFSMLDYLLDPKKKPPPVGYITASSEIILKAPTETLRVHNRNIPFFICFLFLSQNQFSF